MGNTSAACRIFMGKLVINGLLEDCEENWKIMLKWIFGRNIVRMRGSWDWPTIVCIDGIRCLWYETSDSAAWASVLLFITYRCETSVKHWWQKYRNRLTPWRTVLKKLIVAQLVNFCFFFGTP